MPIYSKWAEGYKKATGNSLNYQSIGSSGGIRQINAKTVDFGATDAPVKGEDLDKMGQVQFPAIIGGTVPVVNLDGIKPGELKITGPVTCVLTLVNTVPLVVGNVSVVVPDTAGASSVILPDVFLLITIELMLCNFLNY